VQTGASEANVVSMSWGGSEFNGETAFDSSAYFGRSNVTFVAASGDDGGAYGAEWPAVSPNVVGVGGTTLSLTAYGTIASETAWNASGSWWSGYSGSTGGRSLIEAVPSYQAAAVAGTSSTRATPDVAAVGNPSTGLAVFDTVSGIGQTGWFQIGGTSAGAPLWAGVIAAADQARSWVGKGSLSSSQALNLLYGLSYSSAYTSDFHDITSGVNFAATAKAGYDMVTGLGSPIASQIVAAAMSYNGASAASMRVAATSAVSNTTVTHSAQVQPSNPTPSATTSTVTPSLIAAPVVTATVIGATAPAQAVAAPSSLAGPAVAVADPTSRPAQSVSSTDALALSFRPGTHDGDVQETDLVIPPSLEPEPGLPDVVPFDFDEEAPMTPEPALSSPVWDFALEGYIEELGSAVQAASLPLPVLDGEHSLAILATAVLLLSTLRDDRPRRADRDRTRWLFAGDGANLPDPSRS
jgi:hypothetical protein